MRGKLDLHQGGDGGDWGRGEARVDVYDEMCAHPSQFYY